tara:strand:+ start:1820 stop:2068 length:249 start_codon:yes stop_codon:yes gene_type:complete
MIKRPKNPPICLNCKWFDIWNFEPGNAFKCKAYPNGIPDLIISSEVNHKRPYTNDKNIQYEKTQIVAGNLEERRILQMETFE